MRSLKDLTPAERRLVADGERPEWPRRTAPDPPSWCEVARRIRCPVVLLTADIARGAIVTPDVAEEAAGLMPAARVVHIPGAGHNIRRGQYESFE